MPLSHTAQLVANLQHIKDRIGEALHKANRTDEEVTLVAVTKYVDAPLTAAIHAAGCQTLGESRPQQLWEKAAEPKLAGVQWHMIGHLQRNKVARTLPLVDLIHSVDSLRLLRAINTAANAQGRIARVLLEVNCSGEDAKHGFSVDGLKETLPQLADFTAVEVCGLMTMAARSGGTDVAARNFNSLRELRDQVAADCPPGTQLGELSMGMSHDFEVAIHAGATVVRIGSLLLEGLR